MFILLIMFFLCESTVVLLIKRISEISEDVLAKAKARAEELELMKKNNEVVDFEHFESELARSLTRVKIADKWRGKKYRI